jgi:hypothetical protein
MKSKVAWCIIATITWCGISCGQITITSTDKGDTNVNDPRLTNEVEYVMTGWRGLGITSVHFERINGEDPLPRLPIDSGLPGGWKLTSTDSGFYISGDNLDTYPSLSDTLSFFLTFEYLGKGSLGSLTPKYDKDGDQTTLYDFALNQAGQPVQVLVGVPIPEPSAYGIAGGLAMLTAILLQRQRKRSKYA